jgi:hypothetical protein
MSNRRSDDRDYKRGRNDRSRSRDRNERRREDRNANRVRELERANADLQLRLDEQRATLETRVAAEKLRLRNIETQLKADYAKNVAAEEKIAENAILLRNQHDIFVATFVEREKKVADREVFLREREKAVRERENNQEAKAIATMDAKFLAMEVKCTMLDGKIREQEAVIKGARHMGVILRRTETVMKAGIDGLNADLSASAAKLVMENTLQCIANNVAAFELSLGPDNTRLAVRTLPKKSCIKKRRLLADSVDTTATGGGEAEASDSY